MVTVLAGGRFAGSAAHRRTTSASSDADAGSGELGTRASGGDAFSTTKHYTYADERRTMEDVARLSSLTCLARPSARRPAALRFQNERCDRRHGAPSPTGTVPAAVEPRDRPDHLPGMSDARSRLPCADGDSTNFLHGPDELLLKMDLPHERAERGRFWGRLRPEPVDAEVEDLS
jgi:hypothetical protein